MIKKVDSDVVTLPTKKQIQVPIIYYGEDKNRIIGDATVMMIVDSKNTVLNLKILETSICDPDFIKKITDYKPSFMSVAIKKEDI